MENNKVKLDLLVGKTLRIGVGLSFYLCIFGLLAHFISQPKQTIDVGQLPEVPQKFSFVRLFQGISQLDFTAIAELGIFVLLLTPLLRVVLAFFGYWKTGNKLYTLITAIVLFIVTISVFIGVKH
jgi:uncharacterized membrane protein